MQLADAPPPLPVLYTSPHHSYAPHGRLGRGSRTAIRHPAVVSQTQTFFPIPVKPLTVPANAFPHHSPPIHHSDHLSPIFCTYLAIDVNDKVIKFRPKRRILEGYAHCPPLDGGEIEDELKMDGERTDDQVHVR